MPDDELGIEIKFKPSLKQWQAYEYLTDKETNFIGYGGSAFSGKSYLECYWVTIMSLAYPETGWGLGRKELTNLKKTTLITLFKVFNECNIQPDRDFQYNQQLNLITFDNGSQIFLIDTAYKPSDPLYTRLGGYELTGCAVDESAETDYRAIEILFSRCGRRKNDKYGLAAKMLETFNPAKNHVYLRYYKPYKDGSQKSHIVFVPALPSDNPSPEVGPYIENMLKNASTVTIERLIHGNFEYDDDPAALMPFDKITDIFTNNFTLGGERYITADIARLGRDETVIGVWNGFRLEQIYTIAKNLVTEAASEITRLSALNNVPLSNIIVDEDGVGGGVKDILECEGFVNNSSPLEVEGEKENYNNLKSQCYFKLAEYVNKNLIFVTESNPDIRSKIVQELEQVKQHNMDKDAKKQVMPKDKVKELLGRSPDLSDMIMMRMWFVYRKQFDLYLG